MKLPMYLMVIESVEVGIKYVGVRLEESVDPRTRSVVQETL